MKPHLTNQFLFTMVMVTAAAMLLGTAWMSDDSFITLRVIDNFVRGYGLRFNTIERVQVYTHPLWLMLLTPFYALTREPLITTMLLSVSLSLAALWLVAAKIAKNIGYGSLLVLATAASRSLYEYSTSGLESPLTYLLMALLILQLSGPNNKLIPAGVIGLLLLNRLDLAVLLGPAAAYLWFRAKGERTRVVSAVALPALAWMVFSLVYYGAPFPNTAYAKLGNGYGAGELVSRGLDYGWDFVRHDPLLALIIGKAVFDAARSEDWMDRMLGGGMVLYIAYIIIIGGDFMSGRFFAAPGFMALCMLARSPVPQWLPQNIRVVAPAAVAVVVILLAARIASQPAALENAGISDERQVYYAYTGLVPVLMAWVKSGFEPDHPSHPWWQSGMELKAQAQRAGSPIAVWSDTIGMRGYYAGPNVHILDRVALADAFLARLPAVPGSRVGHYIRQFPPGYPGSVLDPAPATNVDVLRPLLNDVTLATRAPLFAEGRWSAIRRLTFGYYNWIYNSRNYWIRQ